MLHHAEVEERRCVPRDEDAVRVPAIGAEPKAPFADRQALTVAGSEGGKMARCARDVAITAQNRVEEQCPAEGHERLAHAWWLGEWYDFASGRQLAHERSHGRIDRWLRSEVHSSGVPRVRGTWGGMVGAAERGDDRPGCDKHGGAWSHAVLQKKQSFFR